MKLLNKKVLIISGISISGIAAIAIIKKAVEKLKSPIPFSAPITQYFSSAHKAIDISIPTGTNLLAPASGIVESVYYNSLGGYQIVLSHPGLKLFTGFAHLSQQLVSVGQAVKKGQVIGKSGNTGYSTGPHLHFVVMKNGIAINPLDVLK